MTPWIAVTVVSRSSTRALIDTFMTLASIVIRNCARARTASTAVAPERRPFSPVTASPRHLRPNLSIHPIRMMWRTSQAATLHRRRGRSRVLRPRKGGLSYVVLVRRVSRLLLARVPDHPRRGHAQEGAHRVVHPRHLPSALLGNRGADPAHRARAGCGSLGCTLR